MNKYSSLNVRKSEVDMGNGKIKFKLFNLITMSYVLEYEFYINALVDAGSPYQTASAKAQDLSRFYDFFLTASQVLVDRPYTNIILSPLVKIFSAFPQFLAFGVHAQDDLASSVAKILCSPPLKSATVRRVLSTVKIYTVESARIESSLSALRPDNLLNVFSNEVFAKQLLERRNLSPSERNRLVAQSFLAGCICGGAQSTSSSIFKVPKIISRIDLSNFGSKSFPIAHSISFCSGIKSLRDKCLYALLFGGGLRMHEALKLKVENIDFANETVRLSNIEAIDFVKMNYKHHRNKGVNHYEVVMIEPFKSFFFDAAEAYWKHERSSYTSEFFFLMSSRFGNQPMFTMSNQSHLDSFRNNLKKMGLQHLLHLSPHSTRHFYGFYMLNFCPVVRNGEIVSYGYPIDKVRVFMRHSELSSTEKYAIPDIEKMKEQIKTTNMLLERNKFDSGQLRDLSRDQLLGMLIEGRS